MAAAKRSAPLLRFAAVFVLVFGLLTIFAGGTTLFGGATARAAMGNAVPFVLWFNFLAGFAYVTAGVGLLRRRRWAAGLSLAIFLATALVLTALSLHITGGGPYEIRTVYAMVFRTVCWAMIASVARRSLR